MSCRLDVKKAILAEVFKVVIDGRYTYTKISDDTFQINNRIDHAKSKATSGKQALVIGNEIVKRVGHEFMGHVGGYVRQHSPYDPVMVTFAVSDRYIEHEYNNLPAKQRTDKNDVALLSPSVERTHINNNTGIHTNDILFSPDASTQEGMGVFTKYIQFKNKQLINAQQRLNKVEGEKKRKDNTPERVKELNKLDRELTLLINGNFELGIKGLKQDIKELEKNSDILAVGYYAEKDLNRLNKLSVSDNIDDLHEAQKIADFYDLAGTFRRNVENPFFTQDEIFLSDEDGNLTTEYRLSEQTRDQFENWRSRAVGQQNIIDAKKEEHTVNTVNQDTSVHKTYGGKKFSFEDIIKDKSGLKDADWISMWTMDVTQGIFSHNGIIPQVMFSYLVNSFEKKLAWSRDIEERINEITPRVTKELMKLPGGSLRGLGILGLNGASFQMFKEITKEGNETGGLIQRFVKEFYDAQSKALNKFSEKFNGAKLYEDYATRTSEFNKAFEDLKKWRRNNTHIFDINLIPELGATGPEADAYRKHMVSILGERGYKEQLEKQENLLVKYESAKQNMIDTLLTLEGKTEFADLSDKGKADLAYWIINHNPKSGVEDYASVTGLVFGSKKTNNFMDYNVFIPRKYMPVIRNVEGKYHITDGTALTGYHNETFKTIEDNDVLRDFYDIAKEVTERVRQEMPYEMQQKVAVNTLPGLAKTSGELILDKNNGPLSALFLSYKHLMEKIRLSFGVRKQSDISYAVTDPKTGKPNYKVNDSFLSGNTKAVEDRMILEKTKFLQAFNSTIKDKNDHIKAIKRFSTIHISRMNVPSLIHVAQLLHIDIPLGDITAGRIDAIKKVTGENVEIGKYIRDFSLHSVVQTQSFDLPKVLKYFSNITMAYAARQEALPILQIMKDHYENIKKPVTNNMTNQVFNAHDEKLMKSGLRTNANKQMDDWFERVVLDNYGLKHTGIHGASVKDVTDPNTGEVTTKIPFLAKTIYSADEKQKIKEINKLLAKESDEKTKEKLAELKKGFGKERTATALFDNILTWIRTLRLGYNLSSAGTNFFEGVTSNMILASLGTYFDTNEIYYGYNVVKHSFVKNITFGKAETALARKNRSLMDKFNVIMDSKNELQKSSVKTYASKLSWMGPHELNQRVEYINQSPIMIAMLRTLKIKDKNGNESSIWDAYEKTGHLKAQFKTEENIKNWEELNGGDYLSFKQKLHKAIVLAHGNYDELRGMMIKSNSAGKALMMFKTWVPMQLYWRFATEQDDIQSGTMKYKGRYWSYGKGTGALHAAVVGTAVFGPWGLLMGVGGFLLGKYAGVDSGVGLLRETVAATTQLARKMIGMPLNVLAGRKIIATNTNVFEGWVGKGDFTKQDAQNMQANMADITMQLAWLALIIGVKAMLWDDDDEPDSTERQAHNILVNKLMQLSQQAGMYISPTDLYQSTIGTNAVIQYLTDVSKEVKAASEFLHGRDVKAGGIHSGESGLWNQSKKVFLPGLFKDGFPLTDIAKGEMPSLGFDSQAERVFVESPFHPYFKSANTLDKEENKRDRAERRHELQELKIDKKEINKILNEELPTPTRLKKLKQTREEFNQNIQPKTEAEIIQESDEIKEERQQKLEEENTNEE